MTAPTTRFTYCPTHWAYHGGTCPACDGPALAYHAWTAFLSEPDAPRGAYAEELDVFTATNSPAIARRLAEAATDLDFDGLTVRRVERVW